MSEKEGGFLLVYVTIPDREMAQAIAHSAVHRRLAACANITTGVQALYHWKGVIEEREECTIVFKTRRALFGELNTHIAAHHPDEIPGIFAVPIETGSLPFLEWILDETAAPLDS